MSGREGREGIRCDDMHTSTLKFFNQSVLLPHVRLLLFNQSVLLFNRYFLLLDDFLQFFDFFNCMWAFFIIRDWFYTTMSMNRKNKLAMNEVGLKERCTHDWADLRLFLIIPDVLERLSSSSFGSIFLFRIVRLLWVRFFLERDWMRNQVPSFMSSFPAFSHIRTFAHSHIRTFGCHEWNGLMQEESICVYVFMYVRVCADVCVCGKRKQMEWNVQWRDRSCKVVLISKAWMNLSAPISDIRHSNHSNGTTQAYKHIHIYMCKYTRVYVLNAYVGRMNTSEIQFS